MHITVSKPLQSVIVANEDLEKMRFVVLPIFDGVIIDGHPLFWVVDAGAHHQRWAKQKISSVILILI